MQDNRRTIRIMALVSPGDKKIIEALRAKTGRSISDLIRDALISHYAMVARNMPCCATGRACACPQFLAQSPPVNHDELSQYAQGELNALAEKNAAHDAQIDQRRAAIAADLPDVVDT